MDKAEIGKVIDKFGAEVVKFIVFDVDIHNVVKPHYSEKEIREGQSKLLDIATSSLTALIIKWLESKREPYKYGRNQLITELVEELK